jgi:alpha-1,3-mannosyltransferase
MRILHLTPNFLPVMGGIERFVYELCVASRGAGLTPRVLTFDRPDRRQPRLPPTDVIDGIPVRRVPFVDLKYYKPSFLPLDEFTAADIVHVHGMGFPLDFAAATRHVHGRPLVMSTHGGIFHTTALSGVKAGYVRLAKQFTLPQVDRVVACSLPDLELFRPLTDRLTLIENGVNLRRIRFNPAEKQPNTFLFVGRIARNKRVDLLLRAFAALRPTHPDFELRIVGQDWQGEVESLRTLAAELGIADRVTFAGAVDDAALVDEYARASFFVSASEHEGFGISAVEAMAAGCVPVLSDIAAFRRLVTPGVNGLLVDFADAPRTAAAMASLAAADLQAWGQAAMASVEAFSWERAMPKWVELYRQITGSP